MATASDLIRQAALACEKIGYEDTIPAQMNTDGLEMLNNLVSSWSAEGLMIPSIFKFSQALVIGQTQYTIGTGGDFNRARPVKIKKAFIRDTNNNDYPVDIIASDDYGDISYKSGRGRPYKLYYNPTYTTGTIFLYPVPDATTDTLHLDLEDYLSEIAAVGDTVSLPPEYKRAIIYNLAIDWVPASDADNIQVLAKIAKESKEAIERLNIRPVPTTRMDNALRNRRYGFDINSGQYY